MLFDSIIETFVRLVGLVCRWFEQYVISYFLNFGRGFEQVFVLVAIVTFLLITVFLLIKHAKKLPKYYHIEIKDVCGRKIVMEGVKVSFSTYDAAKSYSQFYSTLYKGEYEFRVKGYNRILAEGYLPTRAKLDES